MSSLKDRSAARAKGNGSRAAARQERRGARGKDHEPFRRFVADLEARESQRRPTRARQERVSPITPAQGRLDAAMASHTITFVTGPAGTGKTYLPAARAAEAIRDGEAERIIVTRPTIEAGAASLGFLPGELEEKMAPYFRPVREAFEDVLGSGHVEMLIRNGTIEARPVQFLRGSTFKNAIVLVDEAQNLTPAEMELILTRIGEGTKVVVDGDLRQRDTKGESGLSDAISRLQGHPAIAHVAFSIDDVVRSDIVGDIIKAYAS